MKEIPLNTSWKAHIVFAMVLGIWLVGFLVFIAPFDAEDLSLKIRFILLPPYGVLLFCCYCIGYLVQDVWYKRTGRWDAKKEATIIAIIILIVPFFIYPYYISKYINGDYGLLNFLLLQFLPTSVIILPFIVFGRKYLNKLRVKKDRVLLKGENRGDWLQINPDAIICISSAQNYVDVFYVLEGSIQKKLLRTTLQKIAQQNLGLVQVHRSHLVNPDYFVRWKDVKTALVHTMEIPVSKKFKSSFSEAINIRPQ